MTEEEIRQQQKRDKQKMDTWIKNVMRIEGYTHSQAIQAYVKIFNDIDYCWLPSDCHGNCVARCTYST